LHKQQSLYSSLFTYDLEQVRTPSSVRNREKEKILMTKEPGTLRKMSAAMTIDRRSLLGSFRDGSRSDWETIKSVMAHLGFDLKFIRVVLAPGDTVHASDNVISFPLSGNARAA
jgi:hypothetical protein